MYEIEFRHRVWVLRDAWTIDRILFIQSHAIGAAAAVHWWFGMNES